MSVRIIAIPSRNTSTIVDEDVAEKIGSKTVGIDQCGYAIIHSRQSNGSYKRSYVHRLAVQPPVGMCVDHKNGDKLDNSRENLRIVTTAENARNRHCSPKSKSGFYGVYEHGKYFRISFRRNYKLFSFGGSWRSSEIAAIFSDGIRREFMSEFAAANFPCTIFAEQLRGLLDMTKGRFFRVAFSKRSDGRLRIMNCRIGVTKHLIGGKSSYDAKAHELYLVYDVATRCYKAIPLDRVITVKTQGKSFRVIERRESWAS